MHNDDSQRSGNLSAQAIGTLRGHDWEVAVTLSPDGGRLISATTGYYRPIYLWDTSEQKILSSLEGHEGYVRDIAFANDGMSLATACNDGIVRIWERDGQLRTTLPGHEKGATALTFLSDSSLLFTGDGIGIIRLWDISTGQILFSFLASPDMHSQHPSKNGGGDGSNMLPLVRDMAYSPQQQVLAVDRQSSQENIHLWHFNRERREMQWTGTSFQCDSSHLVFSPNGHVLAVLDHAGKGSIQLRQGDVFESETRIVLPSSWRFSRGPTELCFSPDGRYLAVGDYDGEIGFWDLWNDRPVGIYRAYIALTDGAAPFPSLTGLDWSASGLIATAGWDPIDDVSLLKNNFVTTLWKVKIEEI